MSSDDETRLAREDGRPTGAIPRVEHQRSHREFVQTVQPDHVMLKLRHAERIVAVGETADSYFGPNVDVITTSTQPDQWLNTTSHDDELEAITEFEPAYHIPADVSDYVDLEPRERAERVQEVMEGTLWFHDQLADAGVETELIPLLKGLTEPERDICYTLHDEIGVDYAAVYATRYFSGGGGRRIREFVADMNTVAGETTSDLLVIGLLSPRGLRRLPEQVVAGAGQYQWRTRVKQAATDDEEMRARYQDLVDDVRDALMSPQPAKDTPDDSDNHDHDQETLDETTSKHH